MKTTYIYEIRVEGHVPEGWLDWFEGLTVTNEPNGEAVLVGPIADQAALMGILNRLAATNITLLAVKRLGEVDKV